MDLRDLKLFLHLVESHHFGHTAKAMHISPSTLSRQIQRMEEDIGQALFLRDNRTVRLTEAGEHLKIFAQQTLLQYQQMQLAMSQHGQSLSGELRVFCSVTGAYSHLPTILDRFRARHPLVEIKLTTGDAADAVDKVRSNVADLSIAGHPETLPPSMVFIPIGNIRIALVIPTMPCPVQVQMQDPDPDWAQVPFILPQYGPVRKLTERWFRHQKIANPLIYATVAGHVLHGIRNQFAGRQGVEHTAVTHRDAVIDRNGIELFGYAAGCFDLFRDQLAQVAQVDVPGNELRERVHNGNDRLAKIGVGHPCGAPQGSRSSHITTMRGGG